MKYLKIAARDPGAFVEEISIDLEPKALDVIAYALRISLGKWAQPGSVSVLDQERLLSRIEEMRHDVETEM